MKKVFSLFIISFLCIALLNGCAKPDVPVQEIPQKVVMIDGTLYYCTDQHIELLRCGVMDGEITDFVSPNELPDKDDVSNFGKGYEYQYAGPHHIDIVMPEENNAWIRFCDGQCSDDHSRTLTEELYTDLVGDFEPDYDTELYDKIPITVNPGGPCIVFHTEDCPEGACTIVEEGAGCIRTGNGNCICGYGLPAKENTVTVTGQIEDIETFPGHIQIVE